MKNSKWEIRWFHKFIFLSCKAWVLPVGSFYFPFQEISVVCKKNMVLRYQEVNWTIHRVTQTCCFPPTINKEITMKRQFAPNLRYFATSNPILKIASHKMNHFCKIDKLFLFSSWVSTRTYFSQKASLWYHIMMLCFKLIQNSGPLIPFKDIPIIQR